MRIVFFGSDDFAAVNLRNLLESGHEVAACVTKPDTRQGRGMKLVVSHIKELAQEHGIACLTPVTLNSPEMVEALKAFQADIFVVVAYGKLLSQAVLDIPKIFCVNVHGSLLPKYRGAAPINWAVLNGDKETGVTIQKMVLALDAGDIIAQTRVPIPDEMDAAQLREAMAMEGARLLVKTVGDIGRGNFTLTPQADQNSTYASKLTKEMGRIDWSKKAQSIVNQIRGLKPWPGTFTSYKGKMLKILKAQAVKALLPGKPGEIVLLDQKGITVLCGEGAIMIIEVHPEASKPMPAASFAAGHRVIIHDILS